MRKDLILWFEDIGRSFVNLVGAKCANLGEMNGLGVPVPPGFALTTLAYQSFLNVTDAGREIKVFLEEFPEGPKGLEDCQQISKNVQNIIKSKQIPDELRDSIYQASEVLSNKCGVVNVPTAVRSSCVAEDLPEASFAGQYESYLNVKSKEEVVDTIKSCWASLYTPRAISYRQKNKLAIDGGSISVAVMKMVNARSAGVAFTANPITGDRTKIVLEGNWGAGESVVQGIVTPDQFILDKPTLKLEMKEIHEKCRYSVLAENGVEEREVPSDLKRSACLTDVEAIKIAEYIKKVESHYGIPLDLEWAVDNDLPFPDNIFLLQTRPITVIAKEKDPTEKILDLMMSRLYT